MRDADHNGSRQAARQPTLGTSCYSGEHRWADESRQHDERVRCTSCGAVHGGAAAWQIISAGRARW